VFGHLTGNKKKNPTMQGKRKKEIRKEEEKEREKEKRRNRK
jgi:hypothetical protein